MYRQHRFIPPLSTTDLRAQLQALLLAAMLLVQPLLPLLPTSPLTSSIPASATTSMAALSAPAFPHYQLPPELLDKAEIAALRTLNSATFDLGAGRLARLQEARPLHYQDGAGHWQPINPIFSQVAGQWMNSTNTVRTALDRQRAVATVSSAAVNLQWQPQTLELMNADQRTQTVAKLSVGEPAERSTDGQSVRYPQSWQPVNPILAGIGFLPLPNPGALWVQIGGGTDLASTRNQLPPQAGQGWGGVSQSLPLNPIPLPAFLTGETALVQDQWRSTPGAAEYTMQLATLPTVHWWNATPTALDLRVNLHLQPGTTLQIEGQAVARHTQRATQQPLTFVDANGQALLLQPPRTYEAGDPTNTVAGEYLVHVGDDPSQIELRVRTPWAWLAAPERHFPVIIDPLFQMRDASLVANAYYNPSDGYSFGNNQVGSNNYLGRTRLGSYRMMVRFGPLQMPPGTTIDKAWLYVTPQGVNDGKLDVTRKSVSTNVSAYALDSAAWQSNVTAEPTFTQQPNPLAPGAQKMRYSVDEEQHSGLLWDVTAVAQAQGWLYTGTFAPDVPGILLRAENEECDPENFTVNYLTSSCGAFYFFNRPDNWTTTDLENSQINSTPDAPALNSSTSGGVRVIIFYSNKQTLLENSVIRMDGDATTLPQGLEKNPPYYHADHLYAVAKPPARWQAVVARSQGTPIGVYPPLQQGPLGTFRTPLRGGMALDLRANNDAFSLRKAAPGDDKVSYLLINGRGTGSNLFDQTLPLRTTHSPDATTVSTATTGYDLRLIAEQGTLNAPLNQLQTLTIPFDSNDPLALLNLQLPAGSTSRVKVQVVADGTQNLTYGKLYAETFEAKVVRSDNQATVVTSDFNDLTEGKPWPLAGDHATASGFIYQQPGQYALAIRYNGPQLDVRDIVACSDEICPVEVVHIQYHLKVSVLACPANSFPTNGGTCQKLICPNTGTFAAAPTTYREAAGFAYWSQAGWNGDSNATTANSKIIADGAAPLIGPVRTNGVANAPTVAVLGGRISYDQGNNSVTVTSATAPSEPPSIALVQCPPPNGANGQFAKVFLLFDGALVRSTLLSIPPLPVLRPDPVGSGQLIADPWPHDDASDLSELDFTISPQSGKASGSATLRRNLGIALPSTSLFFQPRWSFDVKGWPQMSSSISADANNPPPPDIASLLLTLGTQLSLDLSPANGDGARVFMGVRAAAAIIAQPAKLGGASKGIQAVILPRGIAVPVIDLLCPASCLDLRGPKDQAGLTIPDRVWQMPDVHTNVDAQTVLMRGAGVLEVYSTDHPSIIDGTTDAVSKEFSFDAYKATVSVDYAPCGGIGPDVLVIKGETSMALPNIGNTGTGGLIAASFMLCETSLRSVHLSFESPVGIPIGSSGLFLTGLRGGISIFPDYTEIKVGLNFQAAPGGDGGIFKAYGEVTIDTRGLFAFEGGAKVLGVVNADGKLWVAWSPLDTGFEINLRLGNWFRGFARAHMWQGQGWQHRYDWLPDNNEMHFAGEIGATITIEDSAIMPLVPPGDISFGIEVAFGQFCTNSSCTSYEWGIKGKFTVAGYDVGLYYGFDEGIDFILGNDDHLLIDEYGGQLVSAASSGGRIDIAPQKINGTASIPFNVSVNAEQILVGVSWQAGAPTLSLIDPDGVEINTGNIAAHNGTTDGNANVTLLGLQQPKPGAWQARLTNLSEAGVEHYRFLYFANKGAPGAVGNHGQFTAPVKANEAATNGYLISWQVPPDTTAQATISLFYERTLSDADALASTGVITGNLLVGAPIVQHLPFSAGSYQWNTTGLLNGEYRIRAAVDDGVNELPIQQISIPDDTCQPVTNGLPTGRAFDANRFPGTVDFTAIGTLLINDSTPPATPTGMGITVADSALLVKWNGTTDPDASGYLLRWGPKNPGNPLGFVPQNQQLVAAPNSSSAPLIYVGAVDNGKEYGIDLLALDVNGNQSAPTAALFATPDGATNLVPLQPQNLVLTGKDGTSASFAWQPNPSGPAAASYQLIYIKLAHFAPVGQLDVTTANATLTGLETGATYDVQVTARNSDGWASVSAGPLRVVISNGVDGDGDGLPDDWATAHNVRDATADSDGDGLNNGAEFAQGSDPNDQDSDNDDASDGEEVTAQSDPLDGSKSTANLTQPRLVLARTILRFTAKQQPDGTAAPQQIGWSNLGSGALQLQASSAASWLQPSIVGNQVQVGINHTNLTPGFYSGVVKLNAAAGSPPLFGDQRCIRVDTWVLPADADTNPQPPLNERLYLPLVLR